MHGWCEGKGWRMDGVRREGFHNCWFEERGVCNNWCEGSGVKKGWCEERGYGMVCVRP